MRFTYHKSNGLYFPYKSIMNVDLTKYYFLNYIGALQIRDPIIDGCAQ